MIRLNRYSMLGWGTLLRWENKWEGGFCDKRKKMSSRHGQQANKDHVWLNYLNSRTLYIVKCIVDSPKVTR